MYFPILLCHTSMHCLCIFLRCPLAPSLRPSWWLPCHQNGSPLILLSLGKRKKVRQSKVKWIGGLFPYGDIALSQELLQGQCVVSIVALKQPGFILAQLSFSSRSLSEAFAAGSFCRRAMHEARTYNGRCPSYWRTWSNCLWLLTWTVLLLSALASLKTSTDCSDVLLSGRTHKSMSHHPWWFYEASLNIYRCLPPDKIWHKVFFYNESFRGVGGRAEAKKQVWFSLKTLYDVLTHLHTELLQIII